MAEVDCTRLCPSVLALVTLSKSINHRGRYYWHKNGSGLDHEVGGSPGSPNVDKLTRAGNRVEISYLIYGPIVPRAHFQFGVTSGHLTEYNSNHLQTPTIY